MGASIERSGSRRRLRQRVSLFRAPVPALQGLDRYGLVFYTGSFSKVLFPSLRLGYLVVPTDLVDRVAAMKSIANRCAPSLDQAVLTDFLVEEHFGRHVRRMRAVTAELSPSCSRVPHNASVAGWSFHLLRPGCRRRRGWLGTLTASQWPRRLHGEAWKSRQSAAEPSVSR